MNTLIISVIGISLVFILVGVIIDQFSKRKSNPNGIADNFSSKYWPQTAYQLGLIKSLNEPAPTVQFQDNKDDTYTLKINPPRGSAIKPFENLEEKLRTFTGALRAESANMGNSVVYKLWMTEPEDAIDLNGLYEWSDEYAVDDMANVPLGYKPDGELATFKADAHTILIGETGAGKGSVLWSIIGSLSQMPNVQLWGVDLKGGVEISMGLDLFKHTALDVEELPDFIENLYNEMSRRLEVMRNEGIRKWDPTPESPQAFLFVDEVNAIMDSISTLAPKVQKEFKKNWNMILQQGRAAGVSVFAAGQDPRSSSLPSRQLFSQRIMLRSRDPQEQIIFFGTESLQHAVTTDFPKSAKGRGLMLDDETGEYIEFKTFYPNDKDIKSWRKK